MGCLPALLRPLLSAARRRRVPIVIVLVVVVALGATARPAHAASASASVSDGGGGWMRPVDGPVVQPFVQPASVYGPGHRGVDFAVAPGTPVRAAADGVVSFAGSVAGTLHVTVAHVGGLRTSSSFLSSVLVREGQTVARGDVLGLTGGAGTDHDGSVLHFGLRIGERYVDPMLLFRPADLTKLVRLVPARGPGGDRVVAGRRAPRAPGLVAPARPRRCGRGSPSARRGR